MCVLRVLAIIALVATLPSIVFANDLADTSSQDELLVAGDWIPIREKSPPLILLCYRLEDTQTLNRDFGSKNHGMLILRKIMDRACEWGLDGRVRARSFLGPVISGGTLVCEVEYSVEKTDGSVHIMYGMWLIATKLLLKHCERGEV